MVKDTAVCNIADDATLNTNNDGLPIVLERLEKDIVILSKWFQENVMKLNRDKCHA